MTASSYSMRWEEILDFKAKSSLLCLMQRLSAGSGVQILGVNRHSWNTCLENPDTEKLLELLSEPSCVSYRGCEIQKSEYQLQCFPCKVSGVGFVSSLGLPRSCHRH